MTQRISRVWLGLPAFLLGLLPGCLESSDVPTTVGRNTALFSPSTGVLPVPTDLLFSGSTDGTLNAPLPSDVAQQGPVVALNALDGWSLAAPFTFPFTDTLDPGSIVAAETVRIFEVTTAATPAAPVGQPVTGIVRELTAEEFRAERATADSTGSTLRIAPTVPLKPATSYMVMLTGGLRDSELVPVARHIEFALAADREPVEDTSPLRPLQILVQAMLEAGEGAGVTRESVILAQTFTTQSIGAVLGAVRRIALGQESTVLDLLCAGNPALDCSDMTPSAFSDASITVNTPAGSSPGTLADLFTGELQLPYYLTAASNAGPGASTLTSDTAPVTEWWRARFAFGTSDTELNLTRFNNVPAATGQETIPVLFSVPNATSGTTKPPGGWPVVIFQHGITTNRTTMLGVADSLAAAGFATIAIDHPLHGVDSTSPFFQGYVEGGVRERTFGLDLLNNTTFAPVPDGVADPSGQHYLNLASLLSGRDNLRQSVADLFSLLSVLDAIDYDGGGADLDASRVSFAGHSLGGMVGVPFLTLSGSDITAASIGMAGGGIAELLANSGSFGPIVLGSLAAIGIDAGTPEFESFLFAAQTALDSGDPISYASLLAASESPVHFVEIIGDGATRLPDQTIPNSVADAPLAGTEPLISALQLAPTGMTTLAGPVRGAVRLLDGSHASYITPTGDDTSDAYGEIQAQISSFIFSDGTALTISTPDLVQQ